MLLLFPSVLSGLQAAKNTAQAAALDAMNPDNMDTQFFNQFESAQAAAQEAKEKVKRQHSQLPFSFRRERAERERERERERDE